MTTSPSIQSHEDLLRCQLSALVEQFQTHSGIPGICLAVATPHGVIEVTRGFRSSTTREALEIGAGFHLQCFSKLLLSIVLLEKAQNGKLKLTRPLGETLGELSSSIHGRDITLVHLLSHTAGYRCFPLSDRATLAPDWERFVAELRESPRLFRPGTVFNYEHTGALLAAEVLQRATGEPLADQLTDLCARLEVSPVPLSVGVTASRRAGGHFFDLRSRRYVPMGVPEASQDGIHSPPDFWVPSLSNLTLSIAEVANIGRALCGHVEGAFREPALLASVRGLMLKPLVRLPRFLVAPGIVADFPTGFSLGAAQYQNGWHGLTSFGPGQCTALRYNPATQISVAAGLNVVQPFALQAIVRAAGQLASGQANPYSSPTVFPQFDPSHVEGRYDDGGSRSCEINSDGRVLNCRFYGSDADRASSVEILLDSEPITLSASSPGAAIAFLPSVDGKAVNGLMFGLNAYRRTPLTGS